MNTESLRATYEVELESLPQLLNLRCRRRLIWQQLASAVRKNSQSLFKLGCMLGQLLHEKGYEKLGCGTFAEVCNRLGISDRRGRRLVNFALFTVDCGAIHGYAQPQPLSGIEFADRLFSARKKISREDYVNMARAYVAAGCASEEVERQLKKLLKESPLSGGNLKKYAEYHSIKFKNAMLSLAKSPSREAAIAEFAHDLTPLQLQSHLVALRHLRQALTRV